MLLLSAGRECTALFNSYHCLTDKPRKYMAAYEIGTITGPSEFPGFAPDNGFYKTLSERVKNYFEMTQQDPKAPSRGASQHLAGSARLNALEVWPRVTGCPALLECPLTRPTLFSHLQACCACCPCLRALRWATRS